MISLKKYLESDNAQADDGHAAEAAEVLVATASAFRSALVEMGSCGVDACPALGADLRRSLDEFGARFSKDLSTRTAAEVEAGVREKLRDWGRRTASHYRAKAQDVKDILLAMARTAQSFGERDHCCAEQINEVTERLKSIACLDDITEIRASIEQSASELKASVDRMTSAGSAAIEQLRAEVSTYQAKLEEAEYIASCDALTGLGSRLWMEAQIQRRIDTHASFCAVMIDVNGFKRVNDQYGHVVGDELLKQFATELRTACTSADVVGRWGGDEFVVLMDGELDSAKEQAGRIQTWVCGKYPIHGKSGAEQLHVDASIGVAAYSDGETLQQLLARADSGMYLNKAASRVGGTEVRPSVVRQGFSGFLRKEN